MFGNKKTQKKDTSVDEAMAVLRKKAQEKDQEVFAKLEKLLNDNGYKIEVQHMVRLIKVK